MGFPFSDSHPVAFARALLQADEGVAVRGCERRRLSGAASLSAAALLLASGVVCCTVLRSASGVLPDRRAEAASLTAAGLISSLPRAPARAASPWQLATHPRQSLRERIFPTARASLAEEASKLRDSVNTYGEALEKTPDSDSATGVELFPAPLSGPQRLARALTFYSRVVPVLFRYKFTEVKLEAEKTLLGRDISEQEECAVWGEVDEWGSSCVSDTISDLKGFYVKTGQVISTRPDLFPEVYTNKLKQLQDGLEPMSADVVRAVVQQELLGGEPLSELFAEFDNEPLGAASIAQVHKAKLLDGRVVAVKVQRPNIEPKLRGDIANLKRISKQLREQLPVDYYTVFCELGRALDDELNFFHEAQAMRKIAAAVSHTVDGEPDDAPVDIPLPIGELVSQRVVVMDYVEGVPLNRLQETLAERNIKPNSPEAKIAGIRILDSLSEAFERMIFGAGFLHGDPHPGNIFVKKGGHVALIDCGQVAVLPRLQRLRLAQTIVRVAEYQRIRRDTSKSSADLKAAIRALAESGTAFGLKFKPVGEGKDPDDLTAAVALLLFGDKDQELPGGYSPGELDENSPIKLLTSFPQELVMMGRATILLKGISARLNVPFSLADAWAPACRTVIAEAEPKMPLWGKKESELVATMATADEQERLRMRDAIKPWATGKAKSIATQLLDRMPEGLQSRLKTLAADRIQRQRDKKFAGNS